jgi:predicted cupin superfamily sugar epimerase
MFGLFGSWFGELCAADFSSRAGRADGKGWDVVLVDDVWQWSQVDLNGEWWMVGCFVVTRGFVIGQSWFETTYE